MATQKKTAAAKEGTKKKQSAQTLAKSAAKTPARSTAKGTQKPTAKKAETQTQMPIPEKKTRNPDSILHQFIPCVFALVAIILCVFLAVPSRERPEERGIFLCASLTPAGELSPLQPASS